MRAVIDSNVSKGRNEFTISMGKALQSNDMFLDGQTDWLTDWQSTNQQQQPRLVQVDRIFRKIVNFMVCCFRHKLRLIYHANMIVISILIIIKIFTFIVHTMSRFRTESKGRP